MCRQNLCYWYIYAESIEILFVESTYILEHTLRLVTGIQEHTDTKLCSIQCTVWPLNETLKPWPPDSSKSANEFENQ